MVRLDLNHNLPKQSMLKCFPRVRSDLNRNLHRCFTMVGSDLNQNLPKWSILRYFTRVCSDLNPNLPMEHIWVLLQGMFRT